MESLLPIILQLVSGAVGGNIAGAVKNLSLGTAGNTVAGGIGGVILGQLLPLLSGGGLDSVLNGVVASWPVVVWAVRPHGNYRTDQELAGKQSLSVSK